MIFVSLGAAAGFIGSAVLASTWVRLTGGIVIILFGFQMIGLLNIQALYRDTRFFSDEKPRGPLGSMVLGVAFAAGWTPCIGPILGGIIGLAATSGGWKDGLILSAFYAAGLAVPFLLTGLGINQFLSFYRNFRQHLHKVEVFSGAVLILIGASIASGYSTRFRLATLLPDLETAMKLKAPTPATISTSQSFAPAPQVRLTTIDGKPWNLSELHGRVVLLNFWASWCGPCRGEIPELNALHKDYERLGLSVVGLAWNDDADEVKEFQKELPLMYPVVLCDPELHDTFSVRSLPTTLVIDREGRVRQTIIGARDRVGFEAIVKPLLDETASTTSS